MRNGFSLVEVLVVVAILAIIAVATLPFLLGGSQETVLTSTTHQIVAVAREAQSQAASQSYNKPWGIHVSNISGTTPFYSIFTGTSYASGSVQDFARLPAGIVFASSTLPAGGVLDVVFAPLSGAPSASATIKLYVQAQPSLSSTITIYSTGIVGFGVPIATTSGSSSSTTTAPAHGIYVVDQWNERVERFDTQGNYYSQFPCDHSTCGSGYSPNGYFSGATEMAIDGLGNIYVADSADNRVEKFDIVGASTTYVSQLGCPTRNCSTGFGANQFGGNPGDLAIDSSNNIYVVDQNNNRVLKFNSSGQPAAYQLGCVSGSCPTSRSPANWQFDIPDGVAVDASGNVYVSDSGDNRIIEFNSSGGWVKQYGCDFGSSGACYTGGGNGEFSTPGDLAIDSLGNIYVVDTGNYIVQKISRTDGSMEYSVPCNSGACTVAVDSSNDVYVADYDNSNIAEYDSSGSPVRSFGTYGNAGGDLNGPAGIVAY